MSLPRVSARNRLAILSDSVVLGLGSALLTLLVMHQGVACAADAGECRRMRNERDRLAADAMEREVALTRRYRERLCPELSSQAELANARDGVYAPIDFAAWSACRRRAERALEASQPVRYRNLHGFTFYTLQGAALARQADDLDRQRQASACP
jgi:hypothetical protein